MKKFLLLALVVTGIHNANIVAVESNDSQEKASGEKSEKTKNIESIIEITLKCTGQVAGSLTHMTEQFLKPVVNPVAREKMKIAQEDFYTAFFNAMSSPGVSAKLVQVYDNIYTDIEVAELLKFYQSDAGKKFMEKAPEAAVKMSEVLSGLMQEHLPVFMNRMEKIQTELNAELNAQTEADSQVK